MGIRAAKMNGDLITYTNSPSDNSNEMIKSFGGIGSSKNASMVFDDGTVIEPQDINFGAIASSEGDALNGNFLNEDIINSEYFGDCGELTVQVSDNGAALILEDGVALGWTTIDALAATTTLHQLTQPNDWIINEDGSLSWLTNSGEVITIPENELFIDGNGNYVTFESYGSDKSEITKIVIYNENGRTVYTQTDRNNDDFPFKSGDYFTNSKGDLVYFGSDEIHNYSADDMFEIYGKRFYVTATNDDGSIKSMLSIDQSTGEVQGIDSDHVWVAEGDNNTCLVTENGDVVYNVDGKVRYIRAEDITTNSDGTMTWDAENSNYQYKIDEGGNLTAVKKPIATSESSHANQSNFPEGADGSLSNNSNTSQIKPNYSNNGVNSPFYDDMLASNNDSSLAAAPPNPIHSVDFSNGDSAIYNRGTGNLQEYTSNGITYHYKASDIGTDGHFTASVDGYTITLNKNGSLSSLVDANNRLITLNDNGQYQYVGTRDIASIPTNVQNAASIILPEGIEYNSQPMPEPSVSNSFTPPKADFDTVAAIADDTGISPFE